jgi:hypothetical protein
VGAVVVVGLEVLVEVALKAGHLGYERAGESGSPALLEDRQLQALDAAVGVRATGLDEALAGAEPLDRLPNSLERNSEPLSLVTSPSRQPAAFSSPATRWTSSRVWRARGLCSEVLSSAQA